MTIRVRTLALTAMILILAGAVFLSGCSGASSEKKEIKVGAKGFAENQIVSRLIQYALEDNGFAVEYIENLDGDVLQTAITTGEIDLYPEYTNTGLVTILKLPPVFDTDEAYRLVKEKFKETYNIVWLAPSGVNDTYCFVLSKKTADRFGISNISQLQTNITEIRAAQGWDWENREDLIPALEAKYGKFNFKDTTIYNGLLVYQILLNDEGDLTIGNTTDPQLEDENLVVLEDDKQVWPPYNLAPIVRQEALDKYPEIEDIINDVSGKLDTVTMISLNAGVILRHEEVVDVARAFYDEVIKGN
jgi:osmoprotectant transport system substrate-binding protein